MIGGAPASSPTGVTGSPRASSTPSRSPPADGKAWSIVSGLEIDAEARKKLDASAAELSLGAGRGEGSDGFGGLIDPMRLLEGSNGVPFPDWVHPRCFDSCSLLDESAPIP